MDVISSKIEYNDDKTIETTIEEVIDKASRNRKRIITTKKLVVKTVEKNKRIQERRNLPKYGFEAEIGNTQNKTTVALGKEQIDQDIGPKKTKEDKPAYRAELDAIMEKTIQVCQNCGDSSHYFQQCPQRQNDKDKERKQDRSSVYQTPRADYSIRISNLSTDVDDEALENVVMHICNDINITVPSRCSVVYDKVTRQSRGCAYVNYPSLEVARQFVAAMDGYHFMSRVLEVELDERTDRDNYNRGNYSHGYSGIPSKYSRDPYFRDISLSK